MEKVFIIVRRNYSDGVWSEYVITEVCSCLEVARRYLYDLRNTAFDAGLEDVDFRIVSYDVISH